MNIVDVNDRAHIAEMYPHWGKSLGKSVARNKVFDLINAGKRAVWPASEIARLTNLSLKTVLIEGKTLVNGQLVLQEPGFPVCYRKREVVQSNKKQIKRAALNKQYREELPTKRNPVARVVHVHQRAKKEATARYISPEDIEQFQKMKAVKGRLLSAGMSLPPLSEEAFKLAIIALIGEPFSLKDWGGEQLDIFSTRPRFKGKRMPTGFALKGPGSVQGTLTPRKMGANGDQVQRLIDDGVEVAVVQYEGQVGQSIHTLLARLAGYKAHQSGHDFYYTVIDKADSIRLRLAYPRAFSLAAASAEAKKASFAKLKRPRRSAR